MPSRVLPAKAVLCATGNRHRHRSGTELRPKTVVALSSHGPIQRASAPLPSSIPPLLHIRRHYHHKHSTKPMDDTLARLFSANEQWSDAVKTADSSFFENSAKGQQPKVPPQLLRRPFKHTYYFRFLDSLAGVLRLPCARKRRHSLAPRLHLRPSQHRQVSSFSTPINIT